MPGSFGASKDKIEQAVKEQRNTEVLAQAISDKQKNTPTADEIKEAEINASLPSFVDSSVFGRVLYPWFKAQYESVWTQVQSKDNLLTQRVTLAATLGTSSLSLRSLTRREQKALTAFEPAVWNRPKDNEPAPNFADQQMEYLALKLVIQVEKLGQTNFPAIKLTPETRDAWRKDRTVVDAYDYLLELDPIYFSQIVAITNDLDTAKHLALLENLKNP